MQARAGGWAFARRYAIWGRELETFEGLAGLGGAHATCADADRALRKTTLDENILAADDRGHIGFWHPGLYQLRDRALGRAPAAPGRRPRRVARPPAPDARPACDRPAGRNWLVNWNNVPAKGWTSGDAPARER